MSDGRARIRSLVATTPQGASGNLAFVGDASAGDYHFTYFPDAAEQAEISLAMPLRALQYTEKRLFPLFQMNLPEGYMLELLRNRFAKTTHFDPMLLLALTGRESAIGRVALHADGIDAETETPTPLSTLLANEGTGNLFKDLAQRYLLRTGISGVQPKLLVPVEAAEMHGKALVATSEFIVKAAGDLYPGLPVNEYICMSIAREAGIPVPEFHLSGDRKRFVMRRFDRTAEGRSLGFEDMAVLMNRAAEDKYKGSYGNIARLIGLYCAPGNVQRSLEQFFDQLALSCMLGNGDAHLKNFGLLYSHPAANDAALSPAYDIVCTTCYIPEDALALTLSGTQSFFQARVDMGAFGREHCGIRDPGDRLFRLAEAAGKVLDRHEAMAAEVPGLLEALRRGIDLFADTYGNDRNRHR